MSISQRGKRILTGGAVAIIASAAVMFFLGWVTAKSGSSAAPETAAPDTKSSTATAAPTTTITKTITATVPAETTPIPAQKSIPDKEAHLEILEHSAAPLTLAAGGNMNFTAKVTGDQQATCHIVLISSDGMTGYTFPFSNRTESGGVVTYTLTAAAPGKPGTYNYYVRAMDQFGLDIANGENAIIIKVN